MRSKTLQIPSVDLRDFIKNKHAFAQQLGEHYRQFGFVGFTHHGIDDATIESARSVCSDFFALDTVTKQRYHQPGTGGARGYTGFGVEQAKGHDQPDLKEFWHVGREVTSINPYPNELLPNFWPLETPELKEKTLALYDALDHLGQRILSALALYLRLDEDWFTDKVNNGNSILRAIHYPPIQQVQAGQVRAAQHEDINVITLLVGSEQSGLEILSRDKQWIPVTSIPGTIVVNIGDMLQRLTNHVLPSTTHRVVNPTGDAIKTTRYSLPFFLHFNPDVLIKTLCSCINKENPDRYMNSITAHAFLQQRLAEIKLK